MNYRKIVVALEVYIKKNGKYLMLKRSPTKRIMPGVWMAPGGKLEFNESLFECARREIYEETNLKIKNLKIKACGTAHLQDLGEEIYFYFLTADYASGKSIQESADGQFAWLTPKQILKLDNLMAELYKVLPFVFDKSAPVISYKANYSKPNQMVEFILEDPS